MNIELTLNNYLLVAILSVIFFPFILVLMRCMIQREGIFAYLFLSVILAFIFGFVIQLPVVAIASLFGMAS